MTTIRHIFGVNNRFCRSVRLARAFLLLISSLSFCTTPLAAQNAPAQITTSEIKRQDAAIETVTGVYPGLLLIPHQTANVIDEKYSQTYHAVCYVYPGDSPTTAGAATTEYLRRFAVHAPDADALPLAKRAAKMLLLVYGINHERLRYDHAFSQTVDVWLTRQNAPNDTGDIGGEQFRNQIYIYNLYSERRPIEWIREIAHEYGHYALPGISGYTAPESWANGVLGERLFLQWLSDDLRDGRLRTDDLPFITPVMLDEFLARQTAPLIRRIARDGLEERQFGRRDAPGMDYYIGFALYISRVYGSEALLDAFAYTEPQKSGTVVRASDFLRGALTALSTSPELTLIPPSALLQNGTTPLNKAAKHPSADSFWVYLPRGEYTVSMQGGLRSWQFAGDAKAVHRLDKNGLNELTVNISDWRKITVALASPTDKPALIRLRRRDAEVR